MRSTDRRIVLGLYRSDHRRELLEHALDRGVTDLDTAYNYRGGASHRTLARVAGDLLPQFRISTKVGYFPDGNRDGHILDPARLRQAIHQSVGELRCEPAVVLLHNPEVTLSHLDPAHGCEVLSEAMAALQQACVTGECRGWGISTWEPASVLAALDGWRSDALPVADVLMVRGGLLVSAATMHASERLGGLFSTAERWAISPFGGNADDAMWDQANPHLFLSAGQQASSRQAAFRLAYELPGADRVAVSTNSAGHLDELLHAMTLDVDHAKIARYRRLLAARQAASGRAELVERTRSGA